MLLRRTSISVAFYLCLLLMTPLPTLTFQEGFTCPENWLKREGNCYGYFEEPVTFAQAREKCQKEHRADLVSFHSREEVCAIAEFVSGFEDDKDVWIGLHDPEKDNVWDWTDSTSFNLYAWLDDTERNNEYCGVLLHSTNYIVWDSRNCETKSPYLCSSTPQIIVREC
ncbi:C-type lectin-like [Podarcis muralis]|uniref:C-type lectin-like n=1 Tax=Podarcis muralis TaxID=64176 RepID=A0A670J235_PODMU|nr:C-type lectin-like [Podarcis muralis]